MSRTRGKAEPAAKRAAIYTRKSTAKGLDEQSFTSLDAQREACEAYARSQGWQALPNRYDDGGFTGANTDRPAFQRLLRDVEEGRVDVVVVHRLDRLTRSLRDFVRLLADFEARGVAFVSVTQAFDSSSALGRLTLNLLASFSEFEREMIAERTRDKIRAAKRRGQWAGGHLPFGYRAERKRLVIDETDAQVVRTAFEEYIRGGGGLLRIARLLNARGWLNRGARWNKNSVSSLIKGASAAGLVRVEGGLVNGEHEAIIDRAVWDEAQAIIERHAERPEPPIHRNAEYLLAGLLRCGACGAAYSPYATYGRGRTRYRYYRCQSRMREANDACTGANLPAEVIERYVIDRIRDLTHDDALAEDVTERLRARVKTERQLLLDRRRRLTTEVSRASEEARKVLDALHTLQGAARDIAHKSLEQAGERVALAEAELAEVDHRLDALTHVDVQVEWVAQALRDFDRLWELMTQENRQRLCWALVQAVTVDEPNNRIEVALVDLTDNSYLEAAS